MKKKRKTPLPLHEQEKIKHIKLIRSVLDNIGFTHIPGIDHKEFTFKDRKGELDDAFFFENIVLLVEYTVSNPPGDHLKKKSLLFSRINEDHLAFLKFIKETPSLKSLNSGLVKIEEKYRLQEIQVRIVYASKYELIDADKKLAPNTFFFDYDIVKYFDVIAKAIKKSTIYEFLAFLKVPHDKAGEKIKNSEDAASQTYISVILPETKSYIVDGVKIVTFYIDAYSLLKRAYVLRNDSWHNEENIELFQRLLIPKKIKAMREFLVDKKGVFINNIIVALSTDDIKILDEKNNILNISDDGEIKGVSSKTIPAKILILDKTNTIGLVDGQHRVFAYHEGTDSYEPKIRELRKNQNLLVSGILLPKRWSSEEKLRFQAKLFLEINSNQQGANSQLKQTIESILSPLSVTSISKHIIEKLNQSGPLAHMFAMRLFDEHKIKFASIISFALNILVRPKNPVGLFSIWNSARKNELLQKPIDDALLAEYQDFCTEKIRDFLIAVRENLPKEKWQFSAPKSEGILNVTTINGMLNCIRDLIANNAVSDVSTYKKRLEHISDFKFKEYKSSQYRKMGHDLYNAFWGSNAKDSGE